MEEEKITGKKAKTQHNEYWILYYGKKKKHVIKGNIP